jgi:S1-C subfamily serine protease
MVPGDVVQAVNGKRVKDMTQLRRIIAAADIGQELEIGIVREGAAIIAKAKLAEMPSAQISAGPGR